MNTKKTVCLAMIAVFAFGMASADNKEAIAKESIIKTDAKVVKLHDGFEFTEGPAVDSKGNIYFTDIPRNRIHKWSIDGKLTTFLENSDGANGLFFDKDGNLIACAGGSKQLVRISMDGKTEVLADKFEGKRFNSLNDLWIDKKGGVYFTDPRYGNRDDMEMAEHVYYLSPDRKTLVRVVDDMVRPNGLIGSLDEKKLYITDHAGEKTFVYNINTDGTLSDKKLFVERSGDGMTIDEQGNIYLAGNGVFVYNDKGQQIELIMAEGWHANVCFGGKNRKTLFITAQDKLFSIEMNVKGL